MNAKTTNLTERKAALEAKKGELTAKRDDNLRRLTLAMTDVRGRHAVDIEEAETAHAARTAELDRALARDARKALYPLAAKFADAPRATAIEFHKTWLALNERAVAELGQELDAIHSVIPFLAAAGDETVAGSEHFTTYFGYATTSGNLNVETLGAAAVEAILRDLEIRAAKVMASPLVKGDPKRFAAIAKHATIGTIHGPLAAFDRLRALEASNSVGPDDEARRQRVAAVQEKNRITLQINRQQAADAASLGEPKLAEPSTPHANYRGDFVLPSTGAR